MCIRDRAKAEQERRAEIAEKYSIYAPYGMTYDTEKDRFFYNGQVVRYFKDQISSNETNGFSYDDSVIDVEPIRDESGTLTGLKQSSDADFNAHTKEQEAVSYTHLRQQRFTEEEIELLERKWAHFLRQDVAAFSYTHLRRAERSVRRRGRQISRPTIP